MKNFAKSVAFFVVSSTLLTVAIWYFFGKINVKATFESSLLDGATVVLDGKEICKTPCAFRPMPGYHTLEVLPPEDYDTQEREWSYDMFAGNLGATLTADFHARMEAAER